MIEHMPPPLQDEERETVSYVLPKRLSKAIARYAIEAELKSKSAAAAKVIESGLSSLAASPTAPEREPEPVAS